jgi:gluconolactonase
MPDNQPELLCDGLAFPEGPAFDRQNNLFVVNLGNGDITRASPDGTKSLFVNTGGKPNGERFHHDGTLWVADAGRKAILRIAPKGEIEVIADQCDGRPFRGPNDLVFDREGNLYFTDPVDSNLENRIGCVYFIPRGGRPVRVDEGLAFPNGIALSHDERWLYYAETNTRRIHRAQRRPDGTLEPRSLFVQLPESGAGPDGIAFDEKGRLYVAHYGRGVIEIVEPDGKISQELPAGGQNPTNLAFGGPYRTSIYITEAETNCVYRLEVGAKGQKLFGDE